MDAKDATRAAGRAAKDAKHAAKDATTAATSAATAATSAASAATSAATTKLSDLGGFIRDQRKAAQKSLRHLANEAGVSNPYLSQIERGLRKPSAEILQQIAKALRISAETLYVKAGILEERDEDLAAAILADGHLTERQKRSLLEIYVSFRGESLESEAPTEPTDRDEPDEPVTASG